MGERLVHDIVKQIKNDMPEVENDLEKVNYVIKKRRDQAPGDILTRSEAELDNQGLSLEEVEDVLGGTLEDSFEEFSIIVNGKYIQGDDLEDYKYTGEWKSDFI